MEAKPKVLSDLNSYEEFSDEEINELAEFFRDLSIEQAFFLKKSYESFLRFHMKECGSDYVQ